MWRRRAGPDFHQQVTQDIRRRVTSCFVAVAANSGRIAGYYTLASAGILVSELPAELRRRLPRYPTLPAVRIGRLAVDGAFRRRGLGELLLMDAAARADRAEQVNYALLVDAKDDAAASFYRRYGFTASASNPRILFLPLATATSLLGPLGRETRGAEIGNDLKNGGTLERAAQPYFDTYDAASRIAEPMRSPNRRATYRLYA